MNPKFLQSCFGSGMLFAFHGAESIENKFVESKSDTLHISKGKTFVFVSGLAGKSIRDQEHSGYWWASIYTGDQDANHGALFGVFNVNAIENLAEFYFKNIDGEVIDHFFVVNEVRNEAKDMKDESTSGPVRFELGRNYPNPFNPKTTIHYTFDNAGKIMLVITDVLGRHIKTLYNGNIAAGPGTSVWDGTNDAGSEVSSGLYLCPLISGKSKQTRKLTLLK